MSAPFSTPSLYGRFVRKLHTIVCAAVFAFSCLTTAQAQGAGHTSAVLHPTLGKTAPRDIRNRDISALPEREQAAWVHGAMSQMVQVYADVNPEGAKCLSAWAFDRGNGVEVVTKYIAALPDELASVTILAVAKKACTEI